MAILASSPGWRLKGPMVSQMRLPSTSVPTTGSIGESRSTMPMPMKTYLCCAMRSRLRATTSTTIMQMMPANSQMT